MSIISPDSPSLIHQEFLSRLFGLAERCPNIVVTAHTNADPDALASALGLRALLVREYPEKSITVILPKLNRIASNLFQSFQFDSPLCEVLHVWPQSPDLLIIVDATDFLLLESPYPVFEDYQISGVGHVVSIDHHSVDQSELKYAEFAHILPNYSSATEIIIEFYRYLEITPDRDIAKFLLAGIITDTGHFRYANSRTLDNAKFLLDLGINIPEINNALYNRMGRSEKIARIKAAMRIQSLHYVNQAVIAVSHVSSYEASACKALLELGADISFIIAFERKALKFRVSSRAREDVIQRYGFHLGEFMQEFGKMCGGSGGGHDGAAGCYGDLKIFELPPDQQAHLTSRKNKLEFDAVYFALLEPQILKLLRKMIL